MNLTHLWLFDKHFVYLNITVLVNFSYTVYLLFRIIKTLPNAACNASLAGGSQEEAVSQYGGCSLDENRREGESDEQYFDEQEEERAEATSNLSAKASGGGDKPPVVIIMRTQPIDNKRLMIMRTQLPRLPAAVRALCCASAGN